MALSCGIIGLPLSGKTTIFNLLTGMQAPTSDFFTGKTSTNAGRALIPDERVDYLSAMFKPKKTTYAQVDMVDVPGLVRGSSQGEGSGNEFLATIRNADLLTHVARAFENDEILHAEDSIDILRDIATIDMELLFADLQIIENRLSRINAAAKKKTEHPLELPTLAKCQEFLLTEKPLKLLQLSAEERESVKHIPFLTDKPLLIIINVDEKQQAAADYPGRQDVEQYCAEQGYKWLTVCAKTEVEIAQLQPEDRPLFLEELGVSEPGVSRIAKAIYDQLGLISFLTAGEDEVRAWTIRRDLPAKAAAGKIHSDIERGFIRAETVAFADLQSCGSMAAARDKGCFRLEGKEYPVKDGDIINFRFNV
ncbi:MAG: redox-regulated ATPase YchF [Clostridia bacterium]|nr:redox-regulated ATPase YchF [Clostridia bacterium]